MTVPVVKRCAKMRLGDIKPKREPVSGWWLEATDKSYLYFPYDRAMKLEIGHVVVTVTKLLKVLRPRYWPDKTLKGISYREGYILYPAHRELSELCRKAFDEEYYIKTILQTDTMVEDKPVICHNFIASHGNWRSYGDKFIRHNHCPSWAAFLALDSLPVKAAS